MPEKKKNRNLCTAKVRKQDEFYTNRMDIEKELVHYTKSFQGKTIYCCADNPAKSAFWFFFHENFQRLGLKRLIATFYGEGAYQMTYEGGADADICAGIRQNLQGGGDFLQEDSALLGASTAQKKAGTVFQHRGKPLNGWSKADRKIAEEYRQWCGSWACEWLRVLKPGASAFVFAGRRMAPRCICALEDAGFIFKDMIAWMKDKAPHRAQRISVIYNRRKDFENEQKWTGWRVGNLRPIFEPILWFTKPYTLGGTLADNVRDYDVGAFNNDAWKNYTDDCSNTIKVVSKKIGSWITSNAKAN